ncbi:HAD family phosphatase [Fibrella sp. HMF5335]|uniref:HAD family phosphatase n=1 Tax=Fibrella rubiginis TaxID=2817060 RepID=A0A939GEZ8_9BACT|nr:HAD family phosphatase [Fibrella rubiginis]MBO0935496.1 HAD family phosphatase [Fibrella rubiginis]
MKNLIFDLGDVIIPIDLRAPLRNFAMLANMAEADAEALWKQHGIWQQHETGLIDDDTFRAAVREIMGNRPNTPAHWADEVIDTAWNSVLLDLPVERIDRIRELASRYRVFMLSNTNAIHIREVNRRLVSLGQPTLEEIFERVFYSHELKMAKPSPDIFQHVLGEAGLVAEETAFFDDNAGNIRAAAALGIQAVHVVPPKTMLDYLQDF